VDGGAEFLLEVAYTGDVLGLEKWEVRGRDGMGWDGMVEVR